MDSDRSSVSSEQLLTLFHELGTWNQVQIHLGLTQWELRTLRKELGVNPNPRPNARKRKSCLESYKEQIAALAATRCTCEEIVNKLALPVKEEQVRRFMHKHGIKLLARQGAQPGEKHRDWKGGRTTDKSGYILVRQPDHPFANHAGYVREHRLVMEQQLGRYLTRKEVVHHINGNRSDNRPENLEVFSSNGEHLAKTRAGCVPTWSEDGKRRLSEAARRPRHRRRVS